MIVVLWRNKALAAMSTTLWFKFGAFQNHHRLVAYFTASPKNIQIYNIVNPLRYIMAVEGTAKSVSLKMHATNLENFFKDSWLNKQCYR